MQSGQWKRYTLAIVAPNLTILDPVISRTPRSVALPGALVLTTPLFTLAGGEFIEGIKGKHRVAFAGVGVTACTVEVGVIGDLGRYFTRFNILQAVADTAAARALQMGATVKRIASPLPNSAAATAAVPVAATVTGAAVGDRVVGCTATYGPAAGFTEAGSTAANLQVIDPNNLEAVVSVVNQVQFIGSEGDLTAFTGTFELISGGGLESDAAAGIAIQATIRTVGANLSLLTAGTLDLWVKTDRAPQAALGVG